MVPTYTKHKIWPLWSMVFTQFSGRFLFLKKNNCLHDLTIKEMKSLMGSCSNSLHTNYSIFYIIKNGPRLYKKTKKQKKRDRALFRTLMTLGFWWADNEFKHKGRTPSRGFHKNIETVFFFLMYWLEVVRQRKFMRNHAHATSCLIFFFLSPAHHTCHAMFKKKNSLSFFSFFLKRMSNCCLIFFKLMYCFGSRAFIQI